MGSGSEAMGRMNHLVLACSRCLDAEIRGGCAMCN